MLDVNFGRLPGGRRWRVGEVKSESVGRRGRARTKLNVNTREGSLGDREVKCEIEVLGFDVVRSGKASPRHLACRRLPSPSLSRPCRGRRWMPRCCRSYVARSFSRGTCACTPLQWPAPPYRRRRFAASTGADLRNRPRATHRPTREV